MGNCSPNASLAYDIRSSGLVTTSAQLEQDAPTIWWPVVAEVMQFAGVTEGMLQHAIIRQLVLRETASASGNIKKNDIRIVLYGHSGTTVPTEGAVYDPSPTNRIGVIDVVQGDYKRVSSTEWEAVPTINGGQGLHFATNAAAPGTDLCAVLLYSGSGGALNAYTNSTASIGIDLHVENCQYTG